MCSGASLSHEPRRLPKLMHPPTDSHLKYKQYLTGKNDVVLDVLEALSVTPTGNHKTELASAKLFPLLFLFIFALGTASLCMLVLSTSTLCVLIMGDNNNVRHSFDLANITIEESFKDKQLLTLSVANNNAQNTHNFNINYHSNPTSNAADVQQGIQFPVSSDNNISNCSNNSSTSSSYMDTTRLVFRIGSASQKDAFVASLKRRIIKNVRIRKALQ